MWRLHQSGGLWWAIPANWQVSRAAASGLLLYYAGGRWVVWRGETGTTQGGPLATGTGSERTTYDPTTGVVTQTGTPIGTITYRRHPSGYYGRSFGDRRPEGLPEYVRPVSERGAAYPYVRAIAEHYGASENVTRALLSLVENESGGEFARPANAYDDPRRRSWGAYQFLNSSWQGMAGEGKSYWYPSERIMANELETVRHHDFGPFEELAYPIRRYILAAGWVARAGGNDVAQAQAIRIYHSGSRWMRRFVDGYTDDAGRHTPGGRERGFDWAARNMPSLAPDDTDEDWNEKMQGYNEDLRRWGVPV